jgi:hypothetical protein
MARNFILSVWISCCPWSRIFVELTAFFVGPFLVLDLLAALELEI